MQGQKQAALSRLNQLEKASARIAEEAAELRKIIEAPERAQSLLTKPEPGSDQRYFRIVANNGIMGVEAAQFINKNEHYYASGNVFQSESIAAAHVEAINTMLLLRHQPGTEKVKDEVGQQYIRPNQNLSGLEFVSGGEGPAKFKCWMISPCFVNKNYAEAAVIVIGAERILRMFKTLRGIYEEHPCLAKTYAD
jgi:hypothetical protein